VPYTRRVSQVELRLVADETSSATAVVINPGQNRSEAGGEIQAAMQALKSGGLFAAHFLDPLQALILNLRVANGLGQHLVQLSPSLLRFALGWLP
jgi:hypothetical protein